MARPYSCGAILSGVDKHQLLHGSLSSLINNTLCKKGLAMQDYKVVWDNPVVEDLLCKCKVGNPHDTHTVALTKVQ